MLRLHFKLKSPVKIDLEGIELTFTICIIIEQYEKKHLTKVKKRVDLDSNHRPDDYELMAAYTIAFYTLLLINGQFYRLVKTNFVFFKDTAFILSKFHFD